MKSLQWVPAAFFPLVLAATAIAQANPASAAYPPDAGITPGILSSLISAPFSIGPGPHSVESAKGSPFSADVTYEFTRVLGDENRIHRESHGRIFRDAEGRIRSEMEDEMPLRTGVLHITIQDPVSQTFVTLFPQNKRAMVNHTMERTDAAARANGVLQPAQAVVPGVGRRPLKKEELGAKEIDGFTASGIRYSNTIAAGEIGNEKPVVTVHETWRSDELKAVLVTVYDDPQSGRRITRLTNIQVGEPDSQLFQIPPDYTVQEFPAKPKTVAKPGQ